MTVLSAAASVMRRTNTTATSALRAAGVAVVFVRLVTNAAAASDIIREARARWNDAGPDFCVEGTRGADFIGPQPLPGDAIISKTRYSAFAHTGLAEQLHSQGIDTLVLAGLTTECCVASTAWDGFERDFHIFIAADACAAYQPDLHQHALKALGASGALIAKAAELQALWKTN